MICIYRGLDEEEYGAEPTKQNGESATVVEYI